jgi:hypothetical protein
MLNASSSHSDPVGRWAHLEITGSPVWATLTDADNCCAFCPVCD